MCSAVSALFKRTSEIQLPLLERVQVGEGVVDEVCREPHFGCGLFSPVSVVGLVFRSSGLYYLLARGRGRGSLGWGTELVSFAVAVAVLGCEFKFAPVARTKVNSTRLRWENNVGQRGLAHHPNPYFEWLSTGFSTNRHIDMLAMQGHHLESIHSLHQLLHNMSHILPIPISISKGQTKRKPARHASPSQLPRHTSYPLPFSTNTLCKIQDRH